MTTAFTTMPSPLGPLTLVADGDALCAIFFQRHRGATTHRAQDTRNDNHPTLMRARRQLDDYFAGRRTRFEMRLAPRGTAFQQTVWQQLQKVPFGRTSTYGAIAVAIGRPGAARAVGAAIGANPLSIVVPCHRILGHDGRLTGYAGGLARKRRLLELEGSALP